MILFVDNYDSFTYNLVSMIGALEPRLRVVRNDALTVDEALAMDLDGLVLSPGPGHPRDAGVCPAPGGGPGARTCRSWACAWATR